MFKVDMTVDANASKYLAKVNFEDRQGTVHSRSISEERTATVNGNYLEALFKAFEILNRPCMVTVYCSSDFIVACFQNGWVTNWEKAGWKNAKGKEVKNAEQWKYLREMMAPHSTRFIYLKGER